MTLLMSNTHCIQGPFADENGYPLKGSKSVWKDKIKKRYPGPNTQVVLDLLPTQWKPDAVILDGMFFINCKPLRNTTTITDYSAYLTGSFYHTSKPWPKKCTCYLT